MEKRKSSKDKCYSCGCKLFFPNNFNCKYCRKWFCEVHRIPEDHNCRGNLQKPGNIKKGWSKEVPPPKWDYFDVIGGSISVGMK